MLFDIPLYPVFIPYFVGVIILLYRLIIRIGIMGMSDKQLIISFLVIVFWVPVFSLFIVADMLRNKIE